MLQLSERLRVKKISGRGIFASCILWHNFVQAEQHLDKKTLVSDYWQDKVSISARLSGSFYLSVQIAMTCQTNPPTKHGKRRLSAFLNAFPSLGSAAAPPPLLLRSPTSSSLQFTKHCTREMPAHQGNNLAGQNVQERNTKGLVTSLRDGWALLLQSAPALTQHHNPLQFPSLRPKEEADAFLPGGLSTSQSS